MGLQELKGCGGLHLGRDHAHKVVFDAHHIDRRQKVFLHNDFQGSRELLVLLLLPMEVLAYGDAVKDECRLRKHG